MVQPMLRFGFQFLDGAVVDDTSQRLLGLEGIVFGDIDIGQQDERLGHPVFV